MTLGGSLKDKRIAAAWAGLCACPRTNLQPPSNHLNQANHIPTTRVSPLAKRLQARLPAQREQPNSWADAIAVWAGCQFERTHVGQTCQPHHHILTSPPYYLVLDFVPWLGSGQPSGGERVKERQTRLHFDRINRRSPALVTGTDGACTGCQQDGDNCIMLSSFVDWA